MGIPVFKAAGSAVATTTTTLALVAPTLAAGDTLIALINSNNNTSPSGFDARWMTLLNDSNTAALQTSIYILPNCTAADSGATFNFTVAGTTVSFGVLVAYSGCSTLQPVQRATLSNASSATVSWPTYTKSATTGLLIATFTYAKNGVTDGGISAGTPSFTNRVLQTTASGNTASIGVYDSAVSVIGAGQSTGARTMATGAVAAVNEGTFFELIGTMDGMGHATTDQVAFPAIQRLPRY